jgi:hypothetical protein
MQADPFIKSNKKEKDTAEFWFVIVIFLFGAILFCTQW